MSSLGTMDRRSGVALGQGPQYRPATDSGGGGGVDPSAAARLIVPNP